MRRPQGTAVSGGEDTSHPAEDALWWGFLQFLAHVVLRRRRQISAQPRRMGGFADAVADSPAGPQAAEAVQQGDGLLDRPPPGARSGSVLDTAAGDDRLDALGPDPTAAAVVVVAAVGVDLPRPLPGPAS